jgi:CheY-like chemotaxis protein
VVNLPSVPPPSSLIRLTDQAAPSSATTEPGCPPLRLLLVEDHQATLEALAALLTKAGHVIFTAGTLAEARELAARHPVDGLISDVGLPDGTGFQLMEELAAKYGLRGIVLSGYGMEDDLRRSREVGFIAHLVKPVRISELRRLLPQLAARS